MDSIIKKIPYRQQIVQYLVITLGALLYALGQTFFIKPLLIPVGGVVGVAMIMNYLWNLPVGVMNIIMNLPLFVLGYRTMGREFFFKTVWATVTSSVFMDVLSGFLPGYEGDMLIAAIFGGAVMGIGFGLVFRMGGTSGGLDIVAKYLNKKRDTPVGSVNFTINIFVYLISALIYKNFESALYAMITSFISSFAVDKMVYGVDRQKSALIITDKPDEVSQAIMSTLGRGVTAMEAKGMYTGESKTALTTVVRRHETSTVKRIMKEIDPGAFVMISEINEVFGQGFKTYEN